MEYHLLGKSRLKISRIGFGAMSLELDKPYAETLVHKVIEQGINYFDTADIYNNGLNESFLGRVLRDKRKNLILATKVGNKLRPDGSGLDWVPTKKYILSSIDKSLERLQTDYIDLYQLHGGTLEDPIDEIIEAFEFLKTAGKIREYGISSIRPNVIREYVKRSSISTVMMQYSLLDRRPEESVFPLLIENGIGVLARGVIAKGLLVSKMVEPYLNYSADQVAKTARLARDITPIPGNSLVASIQFVLSNPIVYSATIGIRTEYQLTNLIEAYHADAVNEFEMKNIIENTPVNYYDKNR